VNNRFNKVVVGVALKNEIYNRGVNQPLLDLYANPNRDAIKDLHDQLLASTNHFDREAAFWLSLALQTAPLSLNLRDMIHELNEMEVLLYDLLWRVEAGSQSDLNNWMNYLANVPQSIQDGFAVDAKILMSLAVQSSRTEAIERIKGNPSLRYKIEILQQETTRLFDIIKKIPLKLIIPEERLDALIALQDILIDLLRRHRAERPESERDSLFRYLLGKLEAAERYLMQSNVTTDKAIKEIALTSDYLEDHIRNETDTHQHEWEQGVLKRINRLLQFLT
jgi:hypothetical protein